MSLCQFSPARRTPIGAAVLGDVGDHDDLRAARHAPPFAEDVEFDLAEAAGEGDLLRRRDPLAAKEDDTMRVVGPLDRGERGVVQRAGQIDAADLGAEGGTGRDDLDGHGRSSCGSALVSSYDARVDRTSVRLGRVANITVRGCDGADPPRPARERTSDPTSHWSRRDDAPYRCGLGLSVSVPDGPDVVQRMAPGAAVTIARRDPTPAAPTPRDFYSGYFKWPRQVDTAFSRAGIFLLSNGILKSASWRRSDTEVALLNRLSTGS